MGNMKPVIMAYALSLGLLTTSFPAEAALRTQAVEYNDGDAVLEGYLAYDDSFPGKRPGVLIVHEWTGPGDYVRSRAEQLARLGYVAFALDMYGKGVRAKDTEEARELSSIYRADRGLMRLRAAAGLRELLNRPQVDSAWVAVIGYCFGGGVALELARSGADIAAAVSLHGSLDTPHPADAQNIKAKILVLHGADDPHVGPEQTAAFQREMAAAGVDWQMVYYGNAVHSFTNPAAGGDPAGAAYNEKADRRSWQAMLDFFDEIFGRR